MSARHRQREEASGSGMPRLGIVLSVVLHLAIAGALILASSRWWTTEIVAAGPGEGGEGGGGAIDVGVSDASALFGFAKPQPVSNIGDRNDAINNTKVEHVPKEDENDEVIPRTDKEQVDPKSVKTDRPVANQQERIFTGKDERAKTDTSAQVGRTYGTPTPATVGGVALGSGGTGGTGLPGGSEYGRRIQMILSRNYITPQADATAVQTVIISIRISRDGRILDVINGRVNPASIRQRAPNMQVTTAAERAVIVSELPPFPPGFLPNVDVVSVNLIFRYPK